MCLNQTGGATIQQISLQSHVLALVPIRLRGLKRQAFFQCFTVDVTFEMLILLKKNKNLICLLLCMVNYVIHFLFFYFLFVQHLNLEC